MRDEWAVVPLETIAQKVTVGHVGSMASEYVDHGIPFLRSTNIGPYRIDQSDIRYISEEFHERLSKSALSPGDVVVVRTGSPGTAAVIPSLLTVANCADLVIIRPSGKVLPRYLAYYINSAAQGHVRSRLVGAVQQHFNVGAAKQLPIHLPPLEEQEDIVEILGALDDKIELNREMNRTLEATAQAIFRSWFVDFDPVVAKADGRKPFGMTDDLATLFPDRFVESELGAIPEGWEVSRVKGEFKLTMGQSPPGRTYNEEGRGTPFYQGRTDFGFRFPTRRAFCTAPSRFAEDGDTLVSVRAPVGDINLAWERCTIGRGLAAVRHVSGSSSFTHYAMKALAPEFLVFEGEGTLFGSMSKKKFEGIKVVSPPREVVEAFQRIAEPVDERLRSAWFESQTLAALRDFLLPRLLSGEIRVAEADERLEAVGA